MPAAMLTACDRSALKQLYGQAMLSSLGTAVYNYNTSSTLQPALGAKQKVIVVLLLAVQVCAAC